MKVVVGIKELKKSECKDCGGCRLKVDGWAQGEARERNISTFHCYWNEIVFEAMVPKLR